VKKLGSRGFWVTITVALIAMTIYYPSSPGARQRRNMSLAEQHIEQKLKPLLANDPRFAHVELYSFTAAGGSLCVGGDVMTQADVDAVKGIVEKSNSPVPITFQVIPLERYGLTTRRVPRLRIRKWGVLAPARRL
jgi:hypothetical protein